MLRDSTILQALFTKTTIGVLLLDHQGSILEANPMSALLFGHSREELCSKSINELLPEIVWDSYFTAPSSTAASPSIEDRLETLAWTKDGHSTPVEVNLSLITLENRQLLAVFINSISVRVKTSEALKESESRLSAVIDTAVDGIITINKRGIVESINASAAKLFGYAPEEVIGQKINMLMPMPERVEHDTYMDNYHQTGVGKIIGIGREVTGLRRDGSLFPFLLSISEVKLKDKTIYTGILHDLSNQKLAEEKLRRYMKALERSNKELQDFAYVSSHDLQEPLRKIRAFGDRLKSRTADKLEEREADYLDRMLNGAERMQRLITDLLEFSRVNTRGADFDQVDLNEVMDRVLSDLEIMIRNSGAKIEIQQLPTIEADSTQMWQLFQNLIKNAIKFSKEGEVPQIRVWSELVRRVERLKATPGDEQVFIFVQDNGIGFDEQYTDKIFQIFQRLEGRKYEGSGIGLAVCMRIANRHGGDIEAQSQPGQGATFKVRLSIKQTKDQKTDDA
ncbi:MAG: PAS domain S-box protein [Bacteroidota bacterium]